MDSISSNNSDSDLSDDWNIINPKEASSIASETESIEVLENEEDCDEQKDSDDIHNDVPKITTDHDILNSEIAVPSSVGEVIVEETDDVAVPYCVFPEEFHNVVTQTDSSVNTPELVCSISLVILCTIASSFMVISSDGTMPSFIDVLIWQGLPDSQKDFNFNNPGLLIQQLKARNDLLENKFNHLGLAVEAFEENMISEAALAEFVVDWQKSVNANSDIKSGNKRPENSEQFDPSSLPEDQQSRDSANGNISDNTDGNYNNDTHQESKSNADQVTGIKGRIGAAADNFVHERNGKLDILLNNVLSLFNATSETGSRLNKATLILLNSKDKISVFESATNYSPRNNKNLQKLKDRLHNIEININTEINRFFNNFSKKISSNVVNFEQNVNEFICKNSEIDKVGNSKLNDLCTGKNKRNLKDNNKFKIKDEMSDERKTGRRKDKLNDYNSYKTDEDTIGKSKENNLKFDYNKKKAYRDDVRKLKDADRKEKYIVKPVDSIKSGKVDVPSDTNQDGITKTSKQTVKEYHNKDTKKSTMNKEKEHKSILNKENVVLAESVPNYGKHEDRNKILDEKRKPNTYREYKNVKKGNYNKRAANFDESDKMSINKNGDELPVTTSDQKNKYYEYDKLSMKRNEKSSNLESKETENNQRNDNHKDRKNNFSKHNFQKDETKKNNDNYRKKDYTNKSKDENLRHNIGKEKKTSQHNNNYKKLTVDDIKKMKEDILTSVNGYIDQLLTDVASNYNEEIKNNGTKHMDPNGLSGDWFLTLGKLRSQIRDKEGKSDWMFDRAEGRHNLRDDSTDHPFGDTFHKKTYWFFRKAWERNRIRI